MQDVRASDGRTLRVYEGGDPGGVPVICHHGTPMSGRLFGPHVEDARVRGIRLIGYDRPGYGGSAPLPGRVVADSPEDVRAIADTLGVDRFAVWGISGGGPHALASAACLAGRVFAAASLAACAPVDAEGLDWTAGMGETNLDEFAATRRGRAALEEYLGDRVAELRVAGAAGVQEQLASLLTPVDRAVLDGELGEYFARCLEDALAGGVAGWRDDDLEIDRPWGFAVEEISVPVLLWHGRHDLFVPLAHGEWLAQRIPGVDARLSEEDGHLTLLARRIPDVHEWLLQRF